MESELRQHCMGIKEFISKDRFANFIGAELLEVADGAATTKLTIKEHLYLYYMEHTLVMYYRHD